MNDGYRMIKKLKENKQTKFAVATIIDVAGSSYRHPGAKMLFGEDGSEYGIISAGCLEEDLGYHAREVIVSRQAKTMIYDLSSEDESLWGQGAGCNGIIKVYVEPSEWDDIWPQVESLLHSGNKLASAIRVSENERTQLFYADNGAVFGDANLKMRIVPELEAFLHSGDKIKLVTLETTEGEFLFELYESRARLYVFGAGPDAEPVARLASDLDFFVTIIDPKSSRCNETVFPTAHAWILEHPESYLQHNQIPDNSYVLVMTHNFQRDQHILRHLIEFPPRYLGVLGSRLRTERLLYPERLPEWIHSPVGLSIGAEGPEEISVSIMAELLKLKNIKDKHI